MKRLFFYLLLAAIITAGYAMYSYNDMGLMRVSFAEYQYRATPFEVGVGALAILPACMVVSYIIQRFINFTATLGEKRSHRQGLHMLTGDYGEQALANAGRDFERVIVQPELRVI
ncbi:MAG: hypothetical protein WBO73_10885 [Gammaproteobacteria bacterium]|jgi:hypothetical protein